MKKLYIFLVALMSAATISAANSRFAQISVSSTGGGDDVLYIAENSDYSPAAENGVDIPKILNNMQAYNINMYVVSGGQNFGMFGTNDLTNVEIAFQSNSSDTQYTLTFAYVTGDITLYDTEAQEYIDVVEGQSHQFSQAVNTTKAARFIINKNDTQELPSSLGTFVSNKKVASVTGAVLYEIIATDGVSNITFQEVNMTNGLAAGTPVLYQKTDATAFVTFTDDAPINGVYANANGFVGLLPGNNSKDEYMEDGDLWALVSDGKLKFVDTYCTLTPGHAYIDMNAINPQQPAPGRRRLMIGRSGIVTDVENVAAEVKGARKSIENGKIVILKNGQKYNVAGQMMK